MNSTGQGVLQPGKTIILLVRALLLFSFFINHSISAKYFSEETPPQIQTTKKNHVYIIYSAENTLHKRLMQQLSDELNKKQPGIVITKTTTVKNLDTENDKKSLIINIGNSVQNTGNNQQKINQLFITTAPNKFSLNTERNKDDAILYMTQPYCRQIRFIKLLNKDWKTISILSSLQKPVHAGPLQRCVKKHGIELYIVNIDGEDDMSNKIKLALSHSNVLLALPDSNIYNSQSVKNILLTSYRYRKPVIAFSKNFTDAGALASIYSHTKQIAQSASNLIARYFDAGGRFNAQIHYPNAFDIELNAQVFRALDLDMPNIEETKKTLHRQEQNEPENSR